MSQPSNLPETLMRKILMRWLSDERFAHDVSHGWRLLFAKPEEVKVMCSLLGIPHPEPALDYYGTAKRGKVKDKKVPKVENENKKEKDPLEALP